MSAPAEPGSQPDARRPDGMSRRQLFRHAGWFGSAVVLTVTGGEVISKIAGSASAAAATGPTQAAEDPTALRFVQISDSHIGFTGPANPDVTASFVRAIDEVNTLSFRPQFVMHTGDLTHLSTTDQFDQVNQMLSQIRTDRVFTVPGEHDSVGDGGRAYRQRFARNTVGDGWYSFDTHGAHFLALVNTLSPEALGHLGHDQIDWVRRDLQGLSSDTPVVVFSHIPLFAMYPKWGWGTDDALQVLSLLRRFASVTCLNGHVHQLFSTRDGNVTFHSATTTAYPLPLPGHGPAPTPQVVPARELHKALGIRSVTYQAANLPLAVKDQELP